MRIGRIAAVLLAVVLAAATVGWRPARPMAAAPRLSAGAARAGAAGAAGAGGPNAYVNPAVCAECHAGIAKTYALTGMGRSFAPASGDARLATFPSRPYFHAPSQTYFAIVRRGGRWFERQWQTGFDGKEANVEEKSIDYVLGSGNHAQTFLHLTARHTLEQLPLGWYAEDGGTWGMIPGYDRADYPGSTRLVQYECMFCHNGYPQIPAGHDQEGAAPVYQLPLPQGIDCQRCHGPGQRHVQIASTTGATLAEIRAAIVNPARLSPEREMEVCMQCHLETTSLLLPHSVQRVNRGTFSYIPGQPLEAYRLSFDRAPGKNTRFEIASAAYRLRESQCFLQTQNRAPADRLQCTTCHDPHDIPRGQAAELHYNAVCRECHAGIVASDDAAGPGGAAVPHPSDPDCIRCHMPKRRTDDAVQVVMTDHRIQIQPPPNLLAPKAEYYESRATSYKGVVVPYYPAKLAPTEENQLDVAVAQVRDDSNLRQGIPELAGLLQKYHPANAAYYLALADALHDAGAAAASAAMYEEALRHAPGSAGILLTLGHAQMDWHQWSNAEATLRRVSRETPDDPVAWALLGEALFQEGKNLEAKEALTKAVELDPDAADPHNYLGALLVRGGDLAGAEAQFREAIRLQPNVAAWQANLAGLLASEGRIPEARYLFELSLRLSPRFAEARINYGRLLVSTGDDAGAEVEAKAAVAEAPGNPEAHELWGYLLAARGDGAGAVRELRTAVRLRPDFWRAQLELGLALRMTGDDAGARAQFRLAARGNDAAVRAAALGLLRAPR